MYQDCGVDVDSAVYQDRGEDSGCVPGLGGGCRLCCVPGQWGGCRLCTRTMGRMQAVYQDRGDVFIALLYCLLKNVFSLVTRQ